ncbi:MarR family transcriptional regulator [Rhodococcus sp. HNM0569]|uniref:MarR family winged helix-turn-helix transcriptional regulator n=1 Tax=Rhodococcus sp. HNM0569 TaxID=2716340 RepID=UPI00146C4256|nr:MarR family transcriptional regulator [Rhodococcus sp. HNM0569]NLU84216.1 MarR family transcriptional regulator [Rhodococcus sp. HNM0569]
MTTPVESIEFEMMLLGRHLNLYNPRPHRDGEHLERSAYTLLSRILIAGPMSIGQLADALGLDSSTLNRQTAAMLSAGLVERIADPDGGIARKFRITDEGRVRLEVDRERNVHGVERVAAEWSDDDRAAFAAYLRRFNRDIERLEGRPWPRPEPAVTPDRSSIS